METILLKGLVLIMMNISFTLGCLEFSPESHGNKEQARTGNMIYFYSPVFDMEVSASSLTFNPNSKLSFFPQVQQLQGI